MIEDQPKIQLIPLFSSRPQAGFPATVDDSIEMALDLNQLVIKNPASTFFVRAEGESMEGIGIFSGDLLIVDRSLEPNNNDIVIAEVYGELTIKRLRINNDVFLLCAENENFEPISVTEEMESTIWGVVTHSVRKFNK